MRFFFPDSHDLVDPTFNFTTEQRSETRVRHRDDLYAHEVFEVPPFDGLLVSKGIVDGIGGSTGKYTIAQRQRLLRTGVREFFRLDTRPETRKLVTMGDCGAFSYIREAVPPYSVDDVITFYSDCGFDYGVSVDHVILAYKPDYDHSLPGVDGVPPEFRARQDLTLKLAGDFLRRHRERKCRFVPVGVAQGWSPSSYAQAVKRLQEIGFQMIALGGMVPLKNKDILDCLSAIAEVLRPETDLHILGVTGSRELVEFAKYGITSFDSTSPLRRAFKDDKNNYYAANRAYSAIRVPQVDGNAKLKSAIQAGKVNQGEAKRLEEACMTSLVQYDDGKEHLDTLLGFLREYEVLNGDKRDRTDTYREVLVDMPWKKCGCDVCQELGIHVIIFRGAERNRRRGFHNLYVFAEQLRAGVADLAQNEGGLMTEKVKLRVPASKRPTEATL